MFHGRLFNGYCYCKLQQVPCPGNTRLKVNIFPIIYIMLSKVLIFVFLVMLNYEVFSPLNRKAAPKSGFSKLHFSN